MKIPVIKKLVESHSIEELQLAESAMLEGLPMSIAVEGDDEGEQLTHILAAMDILQNMKSKNLNAAQALRLYSQRVRKSIS